MKLDTAGFAEAVGISKPKARRALQKCHAGETWRGSHLEVRRVPSRGGLRGWSYEVARDSIPPHFFRAAEAPLIAPSEAPDTALTAGVEPAAPLSAASPASALATSTTKGPVSYPRSRVTGDHERANWCLSLVQQVRQTTIAGTAERATRIIEVARGVTHNWRGRPTKVSDRTLRDWIARYERAGMEGLMRKTPKKAGKRRVHVSRPLDKELRARGLSEAAIADVEAAVRKLVQEAWKNGTPSWPMVQTICQPDVDKIIQEAGVDLTDTQKHRLCEIPRRFIERDSKRFINLAKRRYDRAGFAAENTPRITRSRSDLRPGDWVAADVHHIDIVFRCPDGREVTPKAVAWLDLATNRVRIDPFILPEGQAIRREHVIQSFVSMCVDPNWGVPSRLYTDNGSEYNWAEFTTDLAKLKHSIIHDGSEGMGAEGIGLHRARPYNPQGKVIEGVFSNLERGAFRMIAGYIGGDRMRKKTANQGRKPDPYPGDEQKLKAALATAVEFYHCKKQAGHLKGISPNDSFRAFIDQGWTATILDERELAVAFSQQTVKPVRSGGTIRLDKQDFRADELQSYVEQRVIVRQPLFGDRETLFVFTEFGEYLAIARPDTVFRFGDIAGAKEQARRAKLLKADMTALEGTTEPVVGDGERALAAVVALHGPAPQAPRPDAVIRIKPEFSEAAQRAKDAPARAEEEQDRELAAQEWRSKILNKIAATSR